MTRDLDGLPLRSRPPPSAPDERLIHRTLLTDPRMVVLFWPGYFAPTAPIHRALAALDVGHPLQLRARSDGKAGWEVANLQGVTVTRLSAMFQPPCGQIIAVWVQAILVRDARVEAERNLCCERWELVLPEIEYVPETRGSGVNG